MKPLDETSFKFLIFKGFFNFPLKQLQGSVLFLHGCQGQGGTLFEPDSFSEKILKNKSQGIKCQRILFKGGSSPKWFYPGSILACLFTFRQLLHLCSFILSFILYLLHFQKAIVPVFLYDFYIEDDQKLKEYQSNPIFMVSILHFQGVANFFSCLEREQYIPFSELG